MNKFLFKSTDADLSKILPILDTIQKNVLYLTYRMDMLLKRYDKSLIDKDLKQQVVDYYQTSLQTDDTEQN